MEFRIDDTFTDSLARLTREEQRAVKTAAFDLQVHPANPSIRFRGLGKAKGPNLLSVRVSGEYRTKRVILEIYDEMAEAMRTGIPYKTRLDPPPGPPADERGNFLPFPEWKPGEPKAKDWPVHIHPPREVKTP